MHVNFLVLSRFTEFLTQVFADIEWMRAVAVQYAASRSRFRLRTGPSAAEGIVRTLKPDREAAYWHRRQMCRDWMISGRLSATLSRALALLTLLDSSVHLLFSDLRS